MAERFAGKVRFLKVVRLANAHLAARLGVTTSPTLVFLDGGKEIGERLSGEDIKRTALKARVRRVHSVLSAVEHRPAHLGERRGRDRPARSYRIPWADLLRKVFAVDVLACPDCGGRLRVLAFIEGAHGSLMANGRVSGHALRGIELPPLEERERGGRIH